MYLALLARIGRGEALAAQGRPGSSARACLFAEFFEGAQTLGVPGSRRWTTPY